MNGKFATKALFTLIYEIAISEIQNIDAISDYADELVRLANCLKKQKSYKVDLKRLGW